MQKNLQLFLGKMLHSGFLYLFECLQHYSGSCLLSVVFLRCGDVFVVVVDLFGDVAASVVLIWQWHWCHSCCGGSIDLGVLVLLCPWCCCVVGIVVALACSCLCGIMVFVLN